MRRVSLRIASLYFIFFLEFQSEQVHCLLLQCLIASLIHKKAQFVLNLSHVLFPFTCANQRLLLVAITLCLPRSITKLDKVQSRIHAQTDTVVPADFLSTLLLNLFKLRLQRFFAPLLSHFNQTKSLIKLLNFPGNQAILSQHFDHMLVFRLLELNLFNAALGQLVKLVLL